MATKAKQTAKAPAKKPAARKRPAAKAATKKPAAKAATAADLAQVRGDLAELARALDGYVAQQPATGIADQARGRLLTKCRALQENVDG